jgi:hypothetical protein
MIKLILKNKDEFNFLITKASNDLLELSSVIDSTDDMKAILVKYI